MTKFDFREYIPNAEGIKKELSEAPPLNDPAVPETLEDMFSLFKEAFDKFETENHEDINKLTNGLYKVVEDHFQEKYGKKVIADHDIQIISSAMRGILTTILNTLPPEEAEIVASNINNEFVLTMLCYRRNVDDGNLEE